MQGAFCIREDARKRPPFSAIDGNAVGYAERHRLQIVLLPDSPEYIDTCCPVFGIVLFFEK